jgi:hypothetical protein
MMHAKRVKQAIGCSYGPLCGYFAGVAHSYESLTFRLEDVLFFQNLWSVIVDAIASDYIQVHPVWSIYIGNV